LVQAVCEIVAWRPCDTYMTGLSV